MDPLKNFAGYALRRASFATMADFARRLARLKLKPTEAAILVVLDVNPGITQSDIAQLLDVARANMVPLVSRLLQGNLIIRERVDGRSHGIRLSAAGRRLSKRARRAMAEHEASILRRIPQKHRPAFLLALQCLWMPQAGISAARRGFKSAALKRRRAAASLPRVIQGTR